MEVLGLWSSRPQDPWVILLGVDDGEVASVNSNIQFSGMQDSSSSKHKESRPTSESPSSIQNTVTQLVMPALQEPCKPSGPPPQGEVLASVGPTPFLRPSSMRLPPFLEKFTQNSLVSAIISGRDHVLEASRTDYPVGCCIIPNPFSCLLLLLGRFV